LLIAFAFAFELYRVDVMCSCVVEFNWDLRNARVAKSDYNCVFPLWRGEQERVWRCQESSICLCLQWSTILAG